MRSLALGAQELLGSVLKDASQETDVTAKLLAFTYAPETARVCSKERERRPGTSRSAQLSSSRTLAYGS
ncbi:hypothetical protein [Catelliglobosispora koreensis]|uniref:hypothetical protein n=1 Tax=Catelliglobosispora koreensis TaxID=129052 RepID=UPI0003689422|nr:hypothetical protein [Catelliglobosispora koreensis]